MCGIAGIVNFTGKGPEGAVIQRMTDAIAHRGPDGEGHFIDGPVALGHRRLAIIDLSEAAAQPMKNDDGSVVISYNGETYNFKELRKELEKKGRRFRSNSDTEVIIRGYEEWGIEVVEKLNGIFAFALWDNKRRTLFLCRDRYGVKPLYYHKSGNTLIFASEVKGLLEHPSLKVKVDNSALLEYFTFQNIFTDRTLFDGVKLLPAGHIATIEMKSGEMTLRQYWDYDFREPSEARDMREYEEELDRLFSQAVKRQLMSDVPVGAYLSGGMDSGSITAVAAGEIPHLASFTGGFDLSSASGIELGFDERKRAEALSYRFKTELYEVVMKAGDMERVMGELTWHLEDLRVGQSYPNYYVSRLASKFVKVVLAGTGGDELFAGYPWRYYHTAENQHFDDYVEKYYRYWQRLVPNRTISKLFTDNVWGSVKDLQTINIFREVASHDTEDISTPEEYINRSLYFEAKTFMHGLLLVEDKLSMAHGLELRVPFLDNDLVDFAMKLPIRTKLRDIDKIVKVDENSPGPKKKLYFEKTNDGKIILRNILKKYLPEEYVSGVKQGFSAPDASWFRGDSIDYVKELLYSKDARIYDYLRHDTVTDLVGEHLSGKQNRRLLIWSLISFEWWLKKFT
ncbi:MAG: asparagine synthase (glutamine-hydrolyzing) [Deltaproteobacteria bacterium]|nr:asparagine synthase (glutamine-hydrolyzing) [Deltaproteobacteria bacterium]